MTTESREGLGVLGCPAVMARWNWLMIGVAAVCGVAGLVYLATRTPTNKATAQLIHVP